MPSPLRRSCARRPSARAHASTCSRAALPRSEASRQSSSATISSHRPGAWKPHDEAAVGVGPERVLELVAVAPLLHRRHDRLQREAVEPADAAQRVLDLLGLDRELALVGQHLPGRARMVGGGRDALGRGLEQLDHAGVAVGALGLEHARPHAVAGDRARDEDDVAVGARDAVAPEGERVDGELELVAPGGDACEPAAGRARSSPAQGRLRQRFSACTGRGRRRRCPPDPHRAGCRPSRGPSPGRRTDPAGAAARGAASGSFSQALTAALGDPAAPPPARVGELADRRVAARPAEPASEVALERDAAGLRVDVADERVAAVPPLERHRARGIALAALVSVGSSEAGQRGWPGARG